MSTWKRGRQILGARLRAARLSVRPVPQGHPGEAARARAGHGRLHDGQRRRRAADADAQPRAQQGAARADRPADGHDGGCAASCRPRIGCASSRSASASTASRCATGSWRNPTCPARSRAGAAQGPGDRSQDDITYFLGRETLVATRSPGMARLAREAVRPDVAQRHARDGVLQDPAGARRRARHASRTLDAGTCETSKRAAVRRGAPPGRSARNQPCRPRGIHTDAPRAEPPGQTDHPPTAAALGFRAPFGLISD